MSIKQIDNHQIFKSNHNFHGEIKQNMKTETRGMARQGKIMNVKLLISCDKQLINLKGKG